MSKMKNIGRKIKLWSITILITMVSLIGGSTPISADENQTRAGNNVTSLVSVDDVSLYIEQGGTLFPIIENGVEVPGHPELMVGFMALLKYKWSISDSRTIMDGDFFEFDIPLGYIDIKDTSVFPLSDDQGTIIGTWQIIGGKIKTIFNSNIEGKLSVNNGYFSASGNISKSGEGVELETGGVKLPPITIEPQPIENLPAYPDYGLITKIGSQNLGDNLINWSMFVNYENYKNLYQGLPILQMNDVMLTDELGDDLYYVESKIEIAHTLFRPTDSGEMANSHFSYINIIKEFLKIEQIPGETYEDFYLRVENSSKPAYGVFSRKKLVVNFKNLPNGGNGIKNQFIKSETDLNNLLDNLLSNNEITAAQRGVIFDAYKPTNGANGDVIGFQVYTPTEVTGTSGTYSNTAKLKYNSTEYLESEKSVDFVEVTGGANTTDPGTLTVSKTDEDGDQLENVVFKLEKKNASNDYVDYLALDGGTLTRSTNVAGKVVFSKLEYGEYRLVEVSGLTGYKSDAKYTPDQEFIIDNSQIRGIEIGVLNYLDEGSIELIKKDTSGTTLPGAEFNLYKEDGGVKSYYTGVDANGLATWTTTQSSAQTFVTLADGKISAPGLKIGTYFFVETKAPTGYILDETPVQLDVTKALILAGTPDSKDMTNYRAGSLVITKTDDTGALLTGVEFKLQVKNGTGTYVDYVDASSNIITATTNASGIAEFSALPTGDYKLVETQGLAGYKSDVTYNPGDTFTIDGSETQAIEIGVTNYLNEGSIELIKKDTSGTTLPGAEFNLYKEDGGVKSYYTGVDATGLATWTTTQSSAQTFVTLADGKISAPGLKIGTYFFVETKAPTGYILDETPVQLDVTKGNILVNKTATKDMTNYRAGSLVITKTDDTGALLTGVEFKLQVKNGTGTYVDYVDASSNIITATTNALGIAEFSALPTGDYKLVETQGLAGYKSDATYNPGDTFTIDGSETQAIEIGVTNYLNEGSIELIKKDTSGTTLPGAEFNLYKEDGGVKSYYTGVDANGLATWTTTQSSAQTFVTLADGKISAPGLKIGTYFFVETKAPTGYILDETPVQLDVTKQLILAGTPDSKDMTNYRAGSLVITKTDDTGALLTGVSFKLQVKNGSGTYVDYVDASSNVITATTNALGIAEFSALPTGDYKLVETQGLAGYKSDVTYNPGDTFTIDGSETAAIEIGVTNYLNEGSIELIKKDTSGTTLPGAEFNLYKEDGGVKSYYTGVDATGLATWTTTQSSAQTFVTLADGKISAPGLKIGTYFFVETKAPTGYILDETPVQLDVTKALILAGTPDSKDMTNYRAGSLVITKTDDTGALLTGVSFKLQVKNGSGTYVDYVDASSNVITATTNALGIAEFSALPTGDYKLVETQGLAGYKSDVTYSPGDTFTIDGSETQAIEIGVTNYLNEGSIELIKKDTSGTTLQGAEFNLYKEDAGVKSYYTGVDATGLATWTTTQSSAQTFTTLADGKISAPGLKIGTYFFVETKAPTGYILDETPVQLDVTKALILAGTPDSKDMTNYRAGSLVITKTDDTGALLTGVSFKLQVKNGSGTYVDYVDASSNVITATTNASGIAEFSALPTGDYKLVETQGLAGYKSDVTYNPGDTFTIDGSETQAIEIGVTNYLNEGSIELIKKDTSGTTLPGAEFNLYKEDGGVKSYYTGVDATGLATWTTTQSSAQTFVTLADGKISAPGLKIGTYFFVETKAPTGYILDETPVQLDVTKALILAGTPDSKDMTNYRAGSLVITKTDDTGASLTGVSFKLQVKNGSGTYVDYVDASSNVITATTNASGIAEFSALPTGDYKLVETQGLAGYKSDVTYNPGDTFTIDGSETQAIEIGVTNYLNEGSIELIKKDTSGTTLPGAEFNLYKEDGGVKSYYTGVDATGLATWTTTQSSAQTFVTLADGKISAPGLKIGTYFFVETKAPTGYILDETPVQLDVTKALILAGTPDSKDMTNYRAGSLVITKTDDTGASLTGVSFKLQVKNGSGTYVDYVDASSNVITATTNALGIAEFSALPTGDYKLVETQGLAGYKSDVTYSPGDTFTIDGSETQAIEIGVTNYLNEGSIELIKKDTSGTTLQGAEFNLYKEDAGVKSYYTGVDATGLATWTTTQSSAQTFTTLADGKITATGLKIGTYFFVETKAPTGYELDVTPVQLDVTKNNIITGVTATNTMVNYILGSVTLTKVDSATNTALIGAEFTLFDENDTPIHTKLTDDGNGTFSVTGLSAGNYYFVETKAPTGYELDATPVAFTIVSKDESTVFVTKKNTKIPETHKPQVPGEEEEIRIATSAHPKTGDSTSVGGLASIAMLSIVILGYKVKKRK